MADIINPKDGVQKATKFWDSGRIFGGVVGGYFLYDTYKDERAQGNSRLSALGSGVMSMVMPELLGIGGYIAYEAIKGAPGMLLGAGQSISQQVRQMERMAQDQSPFRSNTFVDSQQIYTMRQAGLALAEQSKYALQQSLMGDEARFMHR